MSVHYTDSTVTLHHGDCLDALRELPDNSVDAVVTDPPYGLSFMGKAWDKPTPRPAGACVECGNDEPAEGFTVCTDCLVTLGPDGDKYVVPPVSDHGGRSMLGHVSKNWHDKGTHSRGYADNDSIAFQAWCLQWTAECLRVLKPGGHLLAFGGTRTWHRLACAVEDAGFEIRDSIAWMYGSGFPKSLDVSKSIDKAAGAEREVLGHEARDYTQNRVSDKPSDSELFGARARLRPITEAQTDAARTWQGWGTALKPAFEPVVVARKPLVGTVAANVLAWGTGALNVDKCRVAGSKPDTTRGASTNASSMASPLGGQGRILDDGKGRWPANVVLDTDQAAALDQQSGELHGKVGMTQHCSGTNAVYGTFQRSDQSTANDGTADRGGASRFFYVAKADASERVRVDGIAHPTVKPLALMRWLVRLVTPPGGTVLEPFAGSGTTVEACILEGFKCVAIEREADYLPLIVQRINRRRDPVAAVRAQGDDDLGLFDLLDGGAA